MTENYRIHWVLAILNNMFKSLNLKIHKHLTNIQLIIPLDANLMNNHDIKLKGSHWNLISESNDNYDNYSLGKFWLHGF